MVEQGNTTNGFKAEQSIETEVFPGHWFCAAILSSGGTYKKSAESPAEFKEVLSNSVIAWVDCWTEEFEKSASIAATQLGFSKELSVSLTTDPYIKYQDFETEMGIKLASIQIRQFDVAIHPLLLFLSKNFVLTVHPQAIDRRFQRLRRYAEVFLKKIPTTSPPEDRLTMLLLRIIDESNERNFEHLRQIEEHGDELAKDMMDKDTPREDLGPKIYQMKHALITYLNALWHTVDVLHALRYGDAELLTNDVKLLTRLSLQTEDVNRQIALAEHLSEVLASGLEVLQTIYNNQLQTLNNRMARVIIYLTVAGTAVLVPNTLATIFGNSAFDMHPEDLWWYIILLVGSTLIATWFVWIWMRKLGWTTRLDSEVTGAKKAKGRRRK